MLTDMLLSELLVIVIIDFSWRVKTVWRKCGCIDVRVKNNPCIEPFIKKVVILFFYSYSELSLV